MFLIIFFILAGALLLVPAKPVLVISSREDSNKCYYSAAGYRNGFIISYTHSVNKGRVHDYYRSAQKDELELYKTQFVSYGAGIPEPYETVGAVFTMVLTSSGFWPHLKLWQPSKSSDRANTLVPGSHILGCYFYTSKAVHSEYPRLCRYRSVHSPGTEQARSVRE